MHVRVLSRVPSVVSVYQVSRCCQHEDWTGCVVDMPLLGVYRGLRRRVPRPRARGRSCPFVLCRERGRGALGARDRGRTGWPTQHALMAGWPAKSSVASSTTVPPRGQRQKRRQTPPDQSESSSRIARVVRIPPPSKTMGYAPSPRLASNTPSPHVQVIPRL